MKTFSQFLQEAKEAKPPKEVLNKISRAYGKRYRGVNVDASNDDRSGDIRLNNIWIPPDQRNQGIGSRAMKGLTQYADRQRKRITLNQAPEPGKKAKLAKFYQSHGFQSNRGRNRDFSTRDTYIRNPRTD
jgi:GNAT superfamily N-acetyltransferase